MRTTKQLRQAIDDAPGWSVEVENDELWGMLNIADAAKRGDAAALESALKLADKMGLFEEEGGGE